MASLAPEPVTATVAYDAAKASEADPKHALGGCQQSLNRRWRRMQGRGKPPQKIVVAVARELAGFVWAIATDQPLKSR